jgi:hypothetical protein
MATQEAVRGLRLIKKSAIFEALLIDKGEFVSGQRNESEKDFIDCVFR